MRNWLRQRWDLGDGVTLTLEVEGPVPLPSETLRLAQEASSTVERYRRAAGLPREPQSGQVDGGYRADAGLAEARQALSDGRKAKAAK